jgi:hypothetical protein
MSLIDQPKATRAEDALDINAVSAFVKSHYPNAHGALDIKQFPRRCIESYVSTQF